MLGALREVRNGMFVLRLRAEGELALATVLAGAWPDRHADEGTENATGDDACRRTPGQPDRDADHGPGDPRHELTSARDQPDGEPGHRGREDDVEAEPGGVGD